MRRFGPIAGLALALALFLLKEPTTPGAWFDIFRTVGPTVLELLAGLVIGWLVLLPDGLISKILGHRWLSRRVGLLVEGASRCQLWAGTGITKSDGSVEKKVLTTSIVLLHPYP